MSRVCFIFKRKMPLAYISHLDMLRLFLRALSRSRLPLTFSQGYNPHPRLALALPLPLGVTAAEEYGEIYFSETIQPEQFINTLSPQLPAALELTGAFEVALDKPSLASLVGAAQYLATLKCESGNEVDFELVQASLKRLMARKEIMVQRKTKKKKTTYTNVRPYIIKAEIINRNDDEPLVLNLLLQAGSRGGISPFFLLEQLESDPAAEGIISCKWQLHRERILINQKGILQPLSEGM